MNNYWVKGISITVSGKDNIKIIKVKIKKKTIIFPELAVAFGLTGKENIICCL